MIPIRLFMMTAMVSLSICLPIVAEPIITDRPDFTESADLVPNGMIQIEGGYTYTNAPDGTNTFGEILIRKTVTSNIELRIGVPNLVIADSGKSGISDANLGIKIKVDPQSAWIIGTSVPIGAPDLRDDALNPFIKYCWGTDLTSIMSLSSNIGVQEVGSGANQFMQWVGSASLGVAINDQFGGYLEVYALSPSDKSSPMATVLNTGVTYLVSDNLQWDFRIGKASDQSAVFAGVGAAIRL